MESLKSIRHHIHEFPELSGNEINTSNFLKSKIEDFQPNHLIEQIGSYSFIAVWDTGIPGPNTLLRADMDALPIKEANKNLSYLSANEGVSHKCGHDGHSTILIGVASRIGSLRLSGKIYLLFQSAEETGEGATEVVKSEKFNALNIDYAFALHNIPGKPLGCIMCKDEVFCPASTGIKIILKGSSSHASEPEKGRTPTPVVKGILSFIEKINKENSPDSFCTLTHIELGEKTFGIQPGDAEIFCTIRSFTPVGYSPFLEKFKSELEALCKKHSIELQLSLLESFGATVNTKEGYDLIRTTAQENNFDFEKMDRTNPWSEDFGIILDSVKSGAMFGLGSGVNTPNLHDPNYDFPDELLPIGVSFFCELLKRSNKKP